MSVRFSKRSMYVEHRRVSLFFMKSIASEEKGIDSTRPKKNALKKETKSVINEGWTWKTIRYSTRTNIQSHFRIPLLSLFSPGAKNSLPGSLFALSKLRVSKIMEVETDICPSLIFIDCGFEWNSRGERKARTRKGFSMDTVRWCLHRKKPVVAVFDCASEWNPIRT